MRRRVALVSGHFVPSNLVGAQRARLWSRYLPEFGWEPIVVTADPEQYEEKPDPDLEHLVASGLRVIHAPTWSTGPVRRRLPPRSNWIACCRCFLPCVTAVCRCRSIRASPR